VTGLAVIGTPPREGFTSLPLSARLGRVPVIGQALSRVVPDGVVRKGLESAFTAGAEVPDEFVDDFRDMTYSSYASTQRATQELLEEKPAGERLEPSGVPLLVIFGAEDDLVDADAADAWGDVRDARVEVLQNTGHSAHWERPREATRLLLDFERSLGGRGG
jgi:pimeloyl-ACP methyl ester carboxylesterase